MRKPLAAANLTLGLSQSEGVVALLKAACSLRYISSFSTCLSYNIQRCPLSALLQLDVSIAVQSKTMLRCTIQASSSADS
jgi:hypothetical protein